MYIKATCIFLIRQLGSEWGGWVNNFDEQYVIGSPTSQFIIASPLNLYDCASMFKWVLS